MRRLFIIAVSALFVLTSLHAQDLENLLDEAVPTKEDAEFAGPAFKASRIVSQHSIKNPGKNELVFLISHRFGKVNTGIYEYFGLDQSTIRLGLEYGITDRIAVGYGRSSNNKVYDGVVKAAILKQQKGVKNIPVSVSLLAGFSVKTLKWADNNLPYTFTHRLTYVVQLMAASRISDRLSLQLNPGLLHRNLVASGSEKNDVAYIGAGGRFKLTNRLSINADYVYVIPNQLAAVNTNPLSVGIDMETGGHVFQLHFSNALGMNERAYIGETTGSWTAGDIHFGFNIIRTFNFNK